MDEIRQTLTLDDRERLSVGAVTEIVSFREDAAELDTALGKLRITGRKLHVDKVDLESGVLLLSGRIDSLYFPEKEAPKKGLLSRIWG